MGAAAYARGSRAISKQIDQEVHVSGVDARADREAHKAERARLLARIRDLETVEKRARRVIRVLRATLTQERKDRTEECALAESKYRFAVRTLARRAGLDGSDPLEIACPFCGQPPGSPCINENDGTQAKHESRGYTHEEMLEALDTGRAVLQLGEEGTAMSTVLRIDMQSRARPLEATGNHVHSCPVCYEHVPCDQTCAVEPDLTLDDGTLRGSYDVCAACEERERR